MKVTTRSNDAFEILLTKDELGAMCNCINEALQIEDPEFQTRVGAPWDKILQDLNTLLQAYDGGIGSPGQSYVDRMR